MKAAVPWFDEAFGKLYPVLYAHRDAAAARREIDFLELQAPLRSGSSILDLACGGGRHLSALRDCGFSAVGIDRSEVLIAMAGEESPGCVARGDMRRLPFADGSFDAVLSLFTSFGYFDDDADDGRVIAQVARVLKPGGVLVLDYLHAGHVRTHLNPRSEKRIRDYTILEERFIRYDRVVKKVVISGGGLPEAAQWEERVRLLEPAQLETMLRFAGLRVRDRFDGLEGAVTGSGPRCVLIAEKAP